MIYLFYIGVGVFAWCLILALAYRQGSEDVKKGLIPFLMKIEELDNHPYQREGKYQYTNYYWLCLLHEGIRKHNRERALEEYEARRCRCCRCRRKLYLR